MNETGILRAPSGPPAMPEICIGQVMHRRLRPRRHSFTYRVFFLRIPLSCLDALPNRWLTRDGFNLMSFVTRDYGPRDGSCLVRWARAQLTQVGLGALDGEVVLQTFPRLLGYVFNPISLWYCYDRAGQLRAAIAEVSNTFGERHNYVMNLDSGGVIAAHKRLHVSPFCEVRGHYRFRFVQNSVFSLAHIDYYEGADDASRLIVTTIAGTPRPLTSATTLSAFLRYPLFTFGVLARIHWQALQLWRKRVPWFRKPAPPTFDTSL